MFSYQIRILSQMRDEYDDAAVNNRTGYKWRLGYTRLDINPDGRR